jgi:hypothetical protein
LLCLHHLFSSSLPQLCCMCTLESFCTSHACPLSLFKSCICLTCLLCFYGNTSATCCLVLRFLFEILPQQIPHQPCTSCMARGAKI